MRRLAWMAFVGSILLSIPAWPADTPAKPPAAKSFKSATVEPIVTRLRREIPRYDQDPLALRALDPTFDTFPDASLVDFSYLLNAPSGKEGWLEAHPDGRFTFSKSKEPVRFWGVTVAASHVDIPKERIPVVVQVIARAGCNLLRLHELDNRGGENYNLVRRNIIDEAWPNNDRSTEFDPEYRDRVDYWIAQAQQTGLYVYLVVRGYRTFRAGDGVAAADQLDRSAKPYAFFDPRLVDLQKQYAREWLLDHVNPYTGIPNGLNPAVCMVELENEDSLFFHYNWPDMIEPYRAEFRAMWNEWLKNKYETTANLRAAWTDSEGRVALTESESLEQGTIALPAMGVKNLDEIHSRPWTDPADAPLRNDDGVRFGMDIQRKYFATLRDSLRGQGCKAMFTAVVNSHFLCDTFTVGEQLDFVGENAYLDHPAFLPGETWVGRSFFTNKNYITETGVWGLMPHMARYRWAGKPLVCREWALCWPNEYRASGTLDIAAMGAFQEFGGLIHFAYYTWGNPDLITPFGPQSDPARWGLMPYASLLFTPGAVKPGSPGVAMAYNNEDLSTWGNFDSPLQRLAWTQRVAEWNPDASFEKDARKEEGLELTVVSGRSGTGAYLGNDLVLYDSNYARRAAMGKAEDRREGLLATSGYDLPWIYSAGGFPVAEVKKAGFQPFLPGESGETCRAFYDEKRNAIVLGPVEESAVVRVADWFANHLHDASRDFASVSLEEPEILKTSNGEIVRDTKNGVLTIATEGVCAATGALPVGKEIKAGALTVQSASPIASVAAAALDGKPLAESRRFSVKMVTVARNRGQDLLKVDPQKNPNAPGTLALGNYGATPVQTEGKPSEIPTRVTLSGRPLVDAYLVNGAWEVVVDLDKKDCLLTCDTSNIRFVLDKAIFGVDVPNQVSITKYFYEYPPRDAGETGWDFVYPGFSKYVHLKAAAK